MHFTFWWHEKMLCLTFIPLPSTPNLIYFKFPVCWLFPCQFTEKPSKHEHPPPPPYPNPHQSLFKHILIWSSQFGPICKHGALSIWDRFNLEVQTVVHGPHTLWQVRLVWSRTHCCGPQGPSWGQVWKLFLTHWNYLTGQIFRRARLPTILKILKLW